ncbi:DJ-1/PfpI family protein [Paraburkholderia terrae]|jgi:transcriptional regulator GlxA family with amidase domain|uniref:DJ-1/PfpI family protein n=1 Tax=Paraburkholderia terrae TaxID=311230 RepID=A0A2I8EZ57_9BURK|nr:DJ-1/PfpI family protein [Paraburkholderia terrae]AUT64903.1 DJ-1/PfpI family protein [Paraburkholderia terrae]
MKVAVVLYEAVEPVDLAVVGVLSMAKRITDDLEYFTVAETEGPVVLQNGLTVHADYAFANAPAVDVVIVTGGPGWTRQTNNKSMLGFLRSRAAENECIASVCTGAMILAAAGLLDGKPATTKSQVAPPEISPLSVLSERFGIDSSEALVIDAGNIVTGGGVTLGIDTTLYLLARYLGEDVASETARIMEYKAARQANMDRLPIQILTESDGQCTPALTQP